VFTLYLIEHYMIAGAHRTKTFNSWKW